LGEAGDEIRDVETTSSFQDPNRVAQPAAETVTLPRLLTTPELAKYLGVSTQVIHHMRHRGDAPVAISGIGKGLRFRAVDVLAWIDLHREEPANGTPSS
jgi:predicted DNA-binding transcriptional regulator AlpA